MENNNSNSNSNSNGNYGGGFSQGGGYPQGGNSYGGGKDSKRPLKRVPKKKVCLFCIDKIDTLDYKDLPKIKKFVTEKGKMIPRRITGTCAKHQRVVAESVKRARIMALLPFKGE